MVIAAKMGSSMKAVCLLFLAACSLSAANYCLVVAGLGGTNEYETQFKQLASDLDRALHANGSTTQIETLSGAQATRARVEEILSRFAGELKSDDSLALLMIGHGSFDGEDYKFNLPGPDMTASQLAALLDHVPAKRQLVVNMTSASGGSLVSLARKNRIVITATKSGNEKNLTVFPRYWLDALRDPAADTDKNGTISALEAFQYAQRKTANYFEAAKLLASEHSMLDDNGSNEGVRDPSPANGQGLLATSFPLIQSATDTQKAASQDKQQLLAKKEELQIAIDKLKYQKAALPEDEYKKQLADLLLQLARTQAEIDR
jgi:hypothetical protein